MLTMTSFRRFERLLDASFRSNSCLVGLWGKLRLVPSQANSGADGTIIIRSPNCRLLQPSGPPAPSPSSPASSQVQVQESPVWRGCGAPLLSQWPSALGTSRSLPQCFPSPLHPLHHTHFTTPIFPSDLAVVNDSAHLSGTDADYTALLGSGANRQTS